MSEEVFSNDTKQIDVRDIIQLLADVPEVRSKVQELITQAEAIVTAVDSMVNDKESTEFEKVLTALDTANAIFGGPFAEIAKIVGVIRNIHNIFKSIGNHTISLASLVTGVVPSIIRDVLKLDGSFLNMFKSLPAFIKNIPRIIGTLKNIFADPVGFIKSIFNPQKLVGVLFNHFFGRWLGPLMNLIPGASGLLGMFGIGVGGGRPGATSMLKVTIPGGFEFPDSIKLGEIHIRRKRPSKPKEEESNDQGVVGGGAHLPPDQGVVGGGAHL